MIVKEQRIYQQPLNQMELFLLSLDILEPIFKFLFYLIKWLLRNTLKDSFAVGYLASRNY